MIDLEYFTRNRPKNDKSRVLFITGDNLGNLPSGYFQVNVRLPPYGSHHTKMSLLKTKSGHLIGNESIKNTPCDHLKYAASKIEQFQFQHIFSDNVR